MCVQGKKDYYSDGPIINTVRTISKTRHQLEKKANRGKSRNRNRGRTRLQLRISPLIIIIIIIFIIFRIIVSFVPLGAGLGLSATGALLARHRGACLCLCLSLCLRGRNPCICVCVVCRRVQFIADDVIILNDKPIQLHPLGRKRRDQHAPVLDGRDVQVLPIVGHRVPDLGEAGPVGSVDDVEDLDAPREEGDVVVLDATEGREFVFGLGGVDEPVRFDLGCVGSAGGFVVVLAALVGVPAGVIEGGFEQAEVPHALFEGGHVSVGPVGGLEVGFDGWVWRTEEVQQDEEGYLREGGLECGHCRVDLLVPVLRECARSVQGIRRAPVLERLLPVEEDDLDAAVLIEPCPVREQPLRLHGRPLARQRRIDAAHRVHNHRARRRAVDGPDEPLRRVLAVIVRDQRQPADVARRGPRGVARRDEVDKGHILVPRHGGLGGRVLEGDVPVGEGRAEEGDEVVQDSGRAGGAGDAGPQDRGEERAGVDVEVVVGSLWEGFEGLVRDGFVCVCSAGEDDGEEEPQICHRAQEAEKTACSISSHGVALRH